MSLLGPLDDLDRRLAPGLRRRPELLFLVIGALVLAGGVTRLNIAGEQQRELTGPVATEDGTAADEPPEASPGGPGEGDVEAYARQRRAALEAWAERAPRDRAGAIVAFERYLEPQAALAAVSDLALDVIGARFRLETGNVLADEGLTTLARDSVEVRDRPLEEILAGLQAEAEAARTHADELASLAESTDDPEFADAFVADRERLLRAAEQVGPAGCPCVYALEVTGRVERLVALLDRPGVRLVDAADPAVPVGQIRAPLPEEH